MASKQNETLKITNEMSLYLRFLLQEGNIICKELTLNMQFELFTTMQKKEISAKISIDGRKAKKDHQK